MGPAGKGTPLLFATIFNFILVGCTALLIWSDNVDNMFIFIQLGLTSVTELLMLNVACKDPGFINPTTYDSSLSRPLTRRDNDIDDAETLF